MSFGIIVFWCLFDLPLPIFINTTCFATICYRKGSGDPLLVYYRYYYFGDVTLSTQATLISGIVEKHIRCLELTDVAHRHEVIEERLDVFLRS